MRDIRYKVRSSLWIVAIVVILGGMCGCEEISEVTEVNERCEFEVKVHLRSKTSGPTFGENVSGVWVGFDIKKFYDSNNNHEFDHGTDHYEHETEQIIRTYTNGECVCKFNYNLRAEFHDVDEALTFLSDYTIYLEKVWVTVKVSDPDEVWVEHPPETIGAMKIVASDDVVMHGEKPRAEFEFSISQKVIWSQ